MLCDRKKVKKNIKLLAKAQILLNLMNVLGNSIIVDNCVSRSGLMHTCQHVDSGGLSSTVMAEDCKHFAHFDGHGQVVNSSEVSELLCQILKDDWIIFVMDALTQPIQARFRVFW